ncbi:MAG: pyrroline-5-carboxylate reductase [Proteobacteria bacterium]|nr:pyrroline-5-carboxylate reductase [Pseudomonadota bacterium]
MRNVAIVGLGNMGQALLKGLIDSKIVERKDISGIEKDKTKADIVAENFKVKVYDNFEVLKNSQVIIIAVKPQNIDEVLEKAKKFTEKKLVISIVAGIKIDYIKKYLKNSKIVRCMPNTPALVLRGITGVYCDIVVNEEEKTNVRKILSAFGEVIFFENEDDIDKVTAISGSGPAYVFYFIESLINAGVYIGLSRESSYKLVKETIEGSLKLLSQTSKEPSQLISMVTSPAGTTINALKVFEREGLKGIIMDAVMTAYKRSKELGKE